MLGKGYNQMRFKFIALPTEFGNLIVARGGDYFVRIGFGMIVHDYAKQAFEVADSNRDGCAVFELFVDSHIIP